MSGKETAAVVGLEHVCLSVSPSVRLGQMMNDGGGGETCSVYVTEAAASGLEGEVRSPPVS